MPANKCRKGTRKQHFEIPNGIAVLGKSHHQMLKPSYCKVEGKRLTKNLPPATADCLIDAKKKKQVFSRRIMRCHPSSVSIVSNTVYFIHASALWATRTASTAPEVGELPCSTTHLSTAAKGSAGYQFFSIRASPRGGLGFLMAWRLGSKSECPKGIRQKLHGLEQTSHGSHMESLPP